MAVSTSPARVDGLPALPGVEHHWLDVPSRAGRVRLHVAEAGTGAPMLLLHGWPQHWWCWRAAIERLRNHYRLLMPDLRGFGWSEAPGAGYSAAGFASDAAGTTSIRPGRSCCAVPLPVSGWRRRPGCCSAPTTSTSLWRSWRGSRPTATTSPSRSSGAAVTGCQRSAPTSSPTGPWPCLADDVRSAYRAGSPAWPTGARGPAGSGSSSPSWPTIAARGWRCGAGSPPSSVWLPATRRPRRCRGAGGRP
jgi:alpha/beta hydrolase family protein